MRPRTFALLLGIPLLLMGALIVGLRIGEDELAQSVRSDPPQQGATSDGDGTAPPSAAARGVRLKRIGTFDDPVLVTAPPGDQRRVFVVEQTGRIRLLLGGKRVRRPFLDLSGDVIAGGEQGLLGLAFAPDYSRSRPLLRLLHGSRRQPEGAGVPPLRGQPQPREQVDAPAADVHGRPVPEPQRRASRVRAGRPALHRDGRRRLGRRPGEPRAEPRLACSARSCESTRAAAARAHTARPQSNPFVGRAGRNEIYAYGLRNPWRFSFDRRTGDLYIGDVGQNELEEIDFASRGQARGRNYGWSCFEGRSRFDESRNCPNPVGPVLQYGRSGGECSVTGGVVVARLRRPRPRRALRVRRLLRRAPAQLPDRGRQGDGRPRPWPVRLVAQLVRRGRARARLRGLPRTARSTGSAPAASDQPARAFGRQVVAGCARHARTAPSGLRSDLEVDGGLSSTGSRREPSRTWPAVPRATSCSSG